MRVFRKFLAVLLTAGLVFALVGCPMNGNGNVDEFDQFFTPTFRSNNAGSVDVMNFTGFDMLLFVGEVLHVNNIWGGVLADSSATLNVSTRQDY